MLPYHFRNGILLAHEGKFCYFLAGMRLEKYLNFHHYLLVTIYNHEEITRLATGNLTWVGLGLSAQ